MRRRSPGFTSITPFEYLVLEGTPWHLEAWPAGELSADLALLLEEHRLDGWEIAGYTSGRLMLRRPARQIIAPPPRGQGDGAVRTALANPPRSSEQAVRNFRD